MRRDLWRHHPHVANNLTLGERAADRLKAGFGSWPFMFTLNAGIAVWIAVNVLLGRDAFDPFPYILLNLGLSWLAAQQGGALQIASNRGDRIASELALHTHENTQSLMEINRLQLAILEEMRQIRGALEKGGTE